MVRAVRGGHIQELAALVTARQEGVVREARPEGDVSRNGTSQHRHRVEDEDAGQQEHGQAEHQDGQTAKCSKHPVQCARSSPSDSAWDRIGEVSQTPEIHREPKCSEEGLRLPLRIPTPLGDRRRREEFVQGRGGAFRLAKVNRAQPRRLLQCRARRPQMQSESMAAIAAEPYATQTVSAPYPQAFAIRQG